MSVETNKIEIIKAILEIDDEITLQSIYEFVQSLKYGEAPLNPTKSNIKSRAEESLKSIGDDNTRSLNAFVRELPKKLTSL